MAHSQYTGVCWDEQQGTWYAQISTSHTMIHLGMYGSEFAAARAYDVMARELFGESADVNFPEL